MNVALWCLAMLYQEVMLVALIVVSAYRLLCFWGESEDGREWKSWFDGRVGEWSTKRRLKYLLADGQSGFFLHGVYLPLGQGLTEIDFVLFHLNGIFVIETKFWSGKVSGAMEDKTWTRETRGGKFQTYSPLRQNAAHVDAVIGVLPECFSHVYGLVHLTGDVELKTREKLPVSVVQGPLRPAIFRMSPQAVFTLAQLEQFRARVAAADPCVANPQRKVEHRVKARAAQLARERGEPLDISAPPVAEPTNVYVLPTVDPTLSRVCRLCGGTMSERPSSRNPGTYYLACDNYSSGQCKGYTVDIN